MLKLEEKVLTNLFQEDINLNGKNTYISQLSIVTIKSLLPSKQLEGNVIDFKRFNEELKLWGYYRVGGQDPILEVIEKINKDNYFKSRDKTIFYRIIPIVLANKDSGIIEDEIIKNILYTSGNIKDLLEGLLVGRIFDLLIKGQKNVPDKLKDFLIRFSQVAYLNKFKEVYRIPISEYPGNYSVLFEKERISLLSIFNGVNSNNYNILNDIVNVLANGNPDSLMGHILYNCQWGNKLEIKLNKFQHNINDYLMRLRKSRINPENLLIRDYILPDVFTFEEGQIFFHSLLNKSKVIKKEVRDKRLTSLIQTKTGMYLFKRDLI